MSWATISKKSQKILNYNYSANLNLYFRNRVINMFYHAYDSYIRNAYPYDELKPITCKGFDTWGR